MSSDPVRAGCCVQYDPHTRQIADESAATCSQRALQVDGVNGESLRLALDRRSISRRELMKVSGIAAAVGAVGFATSSNPAVAAPKEPDVSAAVFDPRKLGKVHTLPSTAQTVHVGAMDPSAEVALTIESGDVVSYPNTWVNWANEARYGMSFAEREPIRKRYPQGPYSLVGPVEIRGAEPGDVIECRMVHLRPIEWGWNSAPKGVGALPGDFSEPYLHYLRFDEQRRSAQFLEGVRIPLAPVQGVMAVQPAGDKPVSAILSGRYGGNIVLRELTAGTALFLPVEVSGARVWTGDSHAAQGDGVVDQTAIETAMEDLRIQYVLHKKVDLAAPLAETPTHWIFLGFGESIEDALVASLRQTISWLSAAANLPKVDIYALCSISGSFRITQYAHQTGTVYSSVPAKTVHGMVPKSIFSADLLRSISASVRSGS